ncbi:MAG: T9SS type A sorting domain-containing protein [Flavobacteriales bacterium]|nr:T9SS type A sorting domain-containing protein [Flavobacteriales bacterium]
MKKPFILLCLSFSCLTGFAQQTSVLFLGNSYIYTQNLPATLYNLALEGGDTIYYESNTPGGYELFQHSTDPTSLSKIASRNWDFVVLQEQSQLPSFPPAQVASWVYPYAEILVDSIRSNYECTEPVFFMTWGRKNGDQANCSGSPLCTFETMQARLRESYLEMGLDNNATVAPCGAAWHGMSVVNNFFWNGLYSSDGSHPSAWGTYLNACVFYATILRKSPVGIPYYSTIGQQDAEDLQQLAEDIVLDSLSTWYIGHADVEAFANYTENGFTVNFVNESENATEFSWNFGDGFTSEEENPQHAYSTADTYMATLVASNGCDSDTVQISVTVSSSPNSTPETDPLADMTILQNETSIVVNNPLTSSVQIQLIDISGRILVDQKMAGNSRVIINQKLRMGVYLIKVSTKNSTRTFKVVRF